MYQSLVFPTQNSWEEDVFRLTPLGIILVAVLIAILVALSLCLFSRNSFPAKGNSVNAEPGHAKIHKGRIAVKQLTFSAMAMALAMVLSNVKLFDMPMGGAVTLCSMFFITLNAYIYGTGAGLMTGLAYGLLQFAIDPVFYTLPQMITDYPLAFGALGLAGLFSKKKWGLQIGYIAGITGRLFFSWLSGLLFFAAYAEGSGMGPALYSLCYNGSYMAAEGIITLIVISLPPVRKGLDKVKKMALE